MKKYNLSIDTLQECEGGSFMGYYSYGHHDKEEFIDTLNGDYGEDIELMDVEKSIEHKYCKAVPFQGTSKMMFAYSKEPKKGYTPITILEV